MIILILLWLGWQLAIPVDFLRSDLGRHIKNGELIAQGHWDVLYKNSILIPILNIVLSITIGYLVFFVMPYGIVSGLPAFLSFI